MGVGARLGDIRAPPEGLESCVLIKPQHKRLLSCDVVQWLSHLGVAGKSCQAKKKKKANSQNNKIPNPWGGGNVVYL